MFILYDKNMNKKEFPQGVRPLDIYISSINKNRVSESVEGRNGIITKGITRQNRSIEVHIGIFANDTRDYRLLRDEVFFFFDDDVFYISERYEKGKRYKVTTLQSYIPERLNQRIAQARFTLELVDLPFAESIGTSMYPRTFDSGFWQVGQGLKVEDLKYAHDTNTFSIYNAGNVTVDPVDGMMLEITYQGASDGLEIKNITTGETWLYNGESGENDTIFFDGIQPLKNDLNIFRDTNRRIITLAPGWNDFELSGTIAEFLISFNFRFYYL